MTDKNDRKPPLLTSDSEPQCRELLRKILPEWDIMSIWAQGKFRDIAEAQREADIKFYTG